MADDVPRMTEADRLATAHVRAERALAPHRERDADERLTRWLDGFEDEIRAVVAPLIAHFVDHPDTPDEIKPLLAAVTDPQQALQAGILFAVLGALAFPLVQAMETANVVDIQQQSFSGRPHVAISPPELALGMIRHTLGNLDAYKEAAKSGIDKTRLDILALNTGDSPAVGDLLLLLRRRDITYDRFVHGLQQSRLRDEWVDDVYKLRFAPPPAAEVITGALKGHLDPNTAALKLSEAGINPENFDWLRATAGRPPGIEQMLHLRNRGQASTADVEHAVRQSDINDDFMPFVLHLGEYHPPVRSIMAMLRAGAINDERATRLFKDQGVLDADIPGYLNEAHHTRAGAVKTLTQSIVVRMYVNGHLSHADAAQRLLALGYQQRDVDLLLQPKADTSLERWHNAVVARAHNLYVAHHVDGNEARNMLTADGVAHDTADELLTLWNIERDAVVHHPTPAQVVHAYRQKYVSAHTAKVRLLALGVQQADLGIIVAAGYPPSGDHHADIDAVVNA